MVDYTKSTGTAGTMMIRDTGTTIEFWLRSSDPYTWSNSLPWSRYVNGSSASSTVVYPSGSPWIKVATYTVTTNQTVRFSIGATGTQGFGGPTDFNQAITRSTKPGKVTNLKVASYGHTGATLEWTRGALNGGTYEHDQIQVSSSPQSGTGNFVGTVEITDTDSGGADYTTPSRLLNPGRKYWAHVRTRTDEGYGEWSSIVTFTTKYGFRIKINGVWRRATVYIKIAGVWRIAVPFIKISGKWRVGN